MITYVKMLLLLLCKHYSHLLESREMFDCKQQDIERLTPLFEFIEAHFERAIQVAEAARVCAMSSSHFMSFFKKATGESFIAYLNNFRIAKAQALLSTTNDPIAEISARLAFCSQSYFGKVFHLAVGMTPLAYRERFSKGLPAGVATRIVRPLEPPRRGRHRPEGSSVAGLLR